MAMKRKLDDSSFAGGIKRTVNWNDIQIGGDVIFVKCLIPSPVAGLVIGKSGETIEKLQQEIGLRLRLSKLTDLYPGTNDRVCIMKGTIDQLTQFVRTYYMDNLVQIEAREHKQQRMELPLQNDRYEFKMIAPVETVGRIIGNAGAVVKEIIKKTKAFIQVSQRPPPNIILPERVMKIAGDVEPILAAVREIFTRFKDDPNHADHGFVSYANAEYVPNAFPAGPAMAQVEGRVVDGSNPYQAQGAGAGPARGQKPGQSKFNGAGGQYGGAAAASEDDGDVRLIIAHDKTPVDNDLLREYMTGFTQQLQVLNCPSDAMQEIIYSVDTLAKYHLLSMAGGKPKQSAISPLWTAPGQSVGYNAMYSKPPPSASQQGYEGQGQHFGGGSGFGGSQSGFGGSQSAFGGSQSGFGGSGSGFGGQQKPAQRYGGAGF